MRNSVRFLILIVIALLLFGCSSSHGLPPSPGEYEIKSNSLTYDGRQYEFFWKDANGELHRASGENFKMVEDSRSFLEISNRGSIIHLTQEEPVAIRGEDRNGNYTSPWFPFLVGTMMGGGFGQPPVIINQPYPGTPQTPPNQPTYHYPPSDTFGRDDSLHGSVTNDKPNAPDYSRVKPAPYAVSGQTGGTGGGAAASNKNPSASGQSGGTGAGSAASNKGGFAAGDSSYRSKSGSAPSSGVSGGGSSAGSSKGGSSKSGAPSSGVSGGKSGGGMSGGGGGRRK